MPTNADVLLPVQRALYARLTGLDLDVYDDVPEGAEFPYVVVGEATTVPDNTLTDFGHRSTVTAHVWSAYSGYSEALGIAGQLVAALDHQPLEVAGFDVIAVHHEQTVTMRDPDRDVRHVPVRFAIYTEQPA